MFGRLKDLIFGEVNATPRIAMQEDQGLRTAMHRQFPALAARWAKLGAEWSPDSNMLDAMEVIQHLPPEVDVTMQRRVYAIAGGAGAVCTWLVTLWDDVAGLSTGTASELPQAVCVASIERQLKLTINGADKN